MKIQYTRNAKCVSIPTVEYFTFGDLGAGEVFRLTADNNNPEIYVVCKDVDFVFCLNTNQDMYARDFEIYGNTPVVKIFGKFIISGEQFFKDDSGKDDEEDCI